MTKTLAVDEIGERDFHAKKEEGIRFDVQDFGGRHAQGELGYIAPGMNATEEVVISPALRAVVARDLARRCEEVVRDAFRPPSLPPKSDEWRARRQESLRIGARKPSE